MEGEFTRREFAKAAESGGFVKVVLRSGWSNFIVIGEMRGGGVATLVTARNRGDARRFLNPAAALAMLREIGVKKVEVQMNDWDPTMASLSMRMRPDVTARRLRDQRIAEAAYYPKRPPETGEVNRVDQLKKLEQTKAIRILQGL